MTTLDEFWYAPRTPLPELDPADKAYSVTVMRQDTRERRTWPFRSQRAAEHFIRRVGVTRGLIVTEWHFTDNPEKEEHTHVRDEAPLAHPHPR